MDLERLADRRADRFARVQRRVRVLEDHLHLAPDRLQPRALQLRDVLTVEADLARRRVEQAHDQPRRRALAAARLADDPERLAAHHVEVDPVDRLHRADFALDHDPARQREVLDQAAHLHQRLARRRVRARLRERLDRAHSPTSGTGPVVPAAPGVPAPAPAGAARSGGGGRPTASRACSGVPPRCSSRPHPPPQSDSSRHATWWLGSPATGSRGGSIRA